MNLTHLPDECGDVFPYSNASLNEISENLWILQENFDQAVKLSSCSNLSPLFQYFSTGSVCTDSIDGLNVLFSLMFAISVLSLIMLTTRAALFNPVIRARRIKRREKEFNEYKSYMTKYYDTDCWEMDPPKSSENNIERFPTMASDDTSSQSILTAADGITIDTRCSSVRERDEVMNVSQQSDSLEDRSALSSSSSFFAFRKSPFYHKEVEVVYYSSDSESDDEYDGSASVAMSLNSGMSTLSALIWKGSGRTPVSSRKPTPEADEQASNIGESTDGSTRSNVALFLKNSAQAIKTPFKIRKMTSPEGQESAEGADIAVEQAAQHHEKSSDPLNLGHLEACLDDSSNTSSVELFVEPPARVIDPPAAPHKKVSAVARTTGARTID